MNSLELDNFIYKYSNRGIIVDTEPLLVLIVGNFDPSELIHIGDENYNEKDSKILFSFLSKFNRLIITPYVIAELSNLANKRLTKAGNFKRFVLECQSVFKNYTESRIKKDKILNRKEAQWLGFPDVSILISSENENLPILIKEAPLLRECAKLGIKTIDFGSLRATYPLPE